jgi:transcriptional regulator with XRE-family HTH domain
MQVEFSLGRLLEALLDESGLTLNALSRESGVPLTSVHRLFHDQVAKPNPAQLGQLARVLNVPVRALMSAACYPVSGVDDLDAALRGAYAVPDEAIAQMRAALDTIAARYAGTTGTGETK